ncbi:DUF6239 family natural product biosynthesis protein [Actinophytocola xanthii]|uniref:Uncharacterized protein n=1 Tax=Actinophytocola xanthii TaxID=1912961 RepID=A0A1Q8CA80_9PSEU|nr:DUF6239 family natural product biosynthesis protein [Actinophytocola xanthii]OLF11281.1 hypothetical protein BU204_30630 [Actinophytocola xanthii]
MALLLAAGGEHGHLELGVSMGPLVLRVALLAAVPVVAGFVLLRGFLAEPSRSTTAGVVGAGCAAATLQLLLAGGLALPEQVVPLLLAALAAPLYLALSREPRFAPAVARVRRFAPWVFLPLAALAAVPLFGAWFGATGPERTLTLLHTGVLLCLVALGWFVVARPRGRWQGAGLRTGAAVLATALVAGVAQASVLRPEEPVPGVARSAAVEVGGRRVEVLVVPNLPGWNLVHVAAPDAEVGAARTDLRPATERAGTTGGWRAVELPAGRAELWVRYRGGVASLATDTGTGTETGPVEPPDGPECASALLGAVLATGGPVASPRCPSQALDPRDLATLRHTVDTLAAEGHWRLAVAADASPRGTAAARAVRSAADRHGLAVVPAGAGDAPLLVVAGWDAAARVSAGPATYLAPWLFTEPVASGGGARYALGFDPDGASFRRYVSELGEDYPRASPSAGGYRAWLAGRLERESTEPRLLPR